MVATLFRGISCWLAYAVLEFGCSTLLPLLQTPDTIISPWYWKITVFLIVTYGVIGAVAGWGISLIPAGFRANAFCALTVAAAAVADRAMEPRQWVTNPSVLILLPVAGLLAWQLIHVEWAERLSPLRNHWVVALLLLAPSWVGKELSPETARPLRIAGAILTLVVVAMLAMLLRRWMSGRSSFLQPLVAVAVLAVIAASAGIVTHHRRQDVKAWAPSSGLPNVVVIVLDTVRQDHVSVYGYLRKTTPNLERFAAGSAVFERAIATSDVTLSSHASLFTGMYASSHGAHYVLNGPPMGHVLRQESTTLAEILSSSGYTTAAVVANFGYLGDGFGLMQGFQHVNCLVPLRMTGGLRNFYVQRGMGREIGMRERVGRIASRILPHREWFQDARRAEEINQDAFGILDESARRKSPLFLFLNYFDTHVPYVPPAPFDRAFPGFDATFSYSGFGQMQEEVISLRRPISPAEQRHLVSQYDGSLAYLDSQIGLLFDRLKALDLYDSSLIVITSDHGEAFGERSLLEHAGISVYQDQVLVPLLIKYPGNNRPTRIAETVSQVDVLPTVLATVGLPVPEGIAGRSLAGQPLDGRRMIISESFPNNFKAQLHARFRRTERAMFLGSLKLIRSTAGKRELYNLAEDPGESRNLYGRDEGLGLEEQLQAWLQSTQGGRPSVPAPKPDPRVMERLRSLGYVQ